jgi:hypothetical protein
MALVSSGRKIPNHGTDEVTVGKYIMFFHGSSKEGMRAQRAHGAASLALAWSDDLVNWSWPR